MALSWIRVDNDLPDHPKSLALDVALGVERSWTHVVQLWLWTSRVVPTGNLSKMPDSVIASKAGWKKDASTFVDALRQAGFLDKDGMLHDWHEYQGKMLERLEKDRERKRKPPKNSAGTPPELHRNSDGSPTEVQRTATGIPPLQYETVRNGTVRDETKTEEHLSSAADAPAQVSLLPEPPPPPAPVDPVEAKIDLVLAHWQRTHGPNIDVSGETQAGLERRRRVRKHLKAKISVEQMIAACDGALRDAYIMGRDPKAPRAYRGVETILRDGTQIEKLAALRGGPNAPGGSGGALKSIREDRHYSNTVEPVRVEWTPGGELARIAAMGRWSKSRTVNVPWDKEWPADVPIPEGYTINRLPKPEPVVRLHDLIGAPLE